MSSSETDRRPPTRSTRANDEYGWIDRYAADLHRSAKELVEKGEAARVSDEALAQIITAAVRLYYAKSELEDRPVPAIVQEGAETLTATEMLVAVSEMLRDVQLGPMELGLWFRRRPGENLPDATARRNDISHSGECCEEQAMNQPVVGRAADAAGPGHRHLDRQPRDPQARQDRRPPAQAAGLVRRRRRRAPCRDGVVERGRAIHRRSGHPRSGAVLPQGPHRRSALRPQRRSRPALPERRRPHPAPGRPAREGRGHQRSPRRDAHPPRDGFARRRQHGRVPDADAVPRPASAARDGGVAVARLQQLDAGEAPVGGRPHQVPGGAAVQHAGGVRAHRQGDRRQEGHHRLRHSLDAACSGASQQVHAALPHDRGDRHAALLPRRLSLGRSVAQDRQPLPRHARAGLRLAQHRALHELGAERHAGPLPQAQGDLDRVRASPGCRS